MPITVKDSPVAFRPRLTSERQTIGVIGGGPSALFFFDNLIKSLPSDAPPNVRLVFFEAENPLGRGAAWNPSNNHFLCNMHADSVLTDPADPTEIAKALGPDAVFATRGEIGEVLAQKWQTSVSEAERRGVHWNSIGESVIDVRRKPAGGFIIETSSGRATEVTAVILAIGQLSPHTYSSLNGLDGYVANPWNYAPNGEEGRVLVLGSSLTSIDVTIALTNAGYKGNVVWASNSGRVPWVRPLTQTAYLTRTKEDLLEEHRGSGQAYTIESLRRDFYRQFQQHGISQGELREIFHMAEQPPVSALRDGLKEIKNGMYFAVMKQLDYCIPVVWNLLDSHGKQAMRNMYRRYARVSFAMPMANAQKILSWLESGRLQVVGGPIALTHNGSDFVLHRTKNGVETREAFDTVVNATGLGSDLAAIQPHNQLIRNLIRSGLVRPHAFGGAECHFETGQLNNCLGYPTVGLFTLNGTLNSGTRLLTNELLEVAMQARRTAYHLSGLLAKNGRLDGRKVDISDPYFEHEPGVVELQQRA